ncbi:ORF100 [Agrotis segetum granulovirus]|uniref:ORF100 n=1 Tax=Agrotis segetum granulosis virus TaxID=10464 RepID=Q6QXK9_GVAS|nr:hypothetical protein AsGV114 [Agrotis segetum granulovirus]AAS82638.1 ORF100 [Agrotis segetum granulovirus]AHN92150.1 hypothetical protein AsGV111 [Agrotis segetum granulovirus]AKN63388.1 hypothetical protein AsGV114 [Agrotis segetum granulovirus]
MNFDYLKDLVSLNPIKITFVSKNLRSNLQFILEDHEKEKRFDPDEQTLLNKLHRILLLFLQDKLDEDTLFQLFGYKLDLQRDQFRYLYDKIKEDIGLRNIINIITNVLNTSDHEEIKNRLQIALEEDDCYSYIASFLIRECNNAIKYI